jgi:prevent-host-death family protein
MNWHLQDAKNNFSKLVQAAIKDGPQTVTLRGARAAVVVSAEEYDRMTRAKPKRSLAQYLLDGPLIDDQTADDINRRSKGPGRPVDF